MIRITHCILSKCKQRNHFSVLSLVAENGPDRKLCALYQKYSSQIRICSLMLLAILMFVCSFLSETENSHEHQFHIFKTLVYT
jgi:hypothetical protein